MRLIWAFFRRDAAIALSYRTAFVMQFTGSLLILALLYFVGKSIGPHALPALERYGGNFLAFVLIGVALTDCVLVSLMSFGQQVREAQMTGTLEATLMSPVSLTRIVIYSSLWNYFLSAARFLVFLTVGSSLFGLNIGHANLPAAFLIFMLTLVCFMGVGIFWAGVVLLIKRGDFVMTALSYVVLLVAGVFFPVSMLPNWMRPISAMVPLTHGLEGMRFALLRGSGIVELAPVLAILCGFAVVLIVGGIAGFNAAVRAAKHNGSLSQY